MPAVAVRTNAVEKRSTSSNPRARKRVRVRAPFKVRLARVSRLIVSVLVLAFVFGYVNVYANLTMTGYNRSKLMTVCREEKLKNERLKVQWNSLSSPHKVVTAAEKSGMVYASDYDYLNKPKTIASAERQ